MRRSAARQASRISIQQVGLALPGWNEDAPQQGSRVWRDSDGGVLSFSRPLEGSVYPFDRSETDQRQFCRELAASRDGGLIEVQTDYCADSQSASLIYKRLQCSSYSYTGMFVTFVDDVSLIWMIVAHEHGTSGIRESVVTANLERDFD